MAIQFNAFTGQLEIVSGNVTPTNTGAPVLSTESPEVSGYISITTGTWNAGPTGYVYQWQTSPDGDTWTNATGTGSTTSTYVCASGDEGKYLRCAVSASNSFGTSLPVYVAAASAVAASSLATGLIADWQFNDLTDSSGNDQTLTNNNGVTVGSGEATFNASDNQYLNSSNPSALWNPQFTWAIDNVQFGDQSAFGGPLLGDENDINCRIVIGSNNSIRLDFNDPNQDGITLTSTIAVTDATVIRAWYDDTTGEAGIQVNSEAPVTGTLTYGAGFFANYGYPIDFCINYSVYYGSASCSGSIGRTRVWNRVLSPTERSEV